MTPQNPRLLNMLRAQAYIGSMHGQIEPVITRFKSVNRYAQWKPRFDADKAQKDSDAKLHRFFVLAFRLKHGLRTIAAEENGQMQPLNPTP